MPSSTVRPQEGDLAVSPVRFPRAERLEFDVSLGDRTTTVWFEADCSVAPSAAPVLPTLLPIAMRARSPLTLPDAHDATAIANAHRAATTLSAWFPELLPVEIDAPAMPSTTSVANGVGCFFSGGVDSYYSVLDRLDEITHLIFVQGFDIGIDDHALGAEVIDEARAAAAELGRQLIVVRTNIRALSDPHLDWGVHFHGAALAAVAQLLGNHLARVILPATYHRSELFPWGSHPELDPLWSSSTVTVVHHGEERTRPQKVAAIATSPVAMAHLRVCWENRGGRYNCGECEKCVRTMINLRVVGALERCATLPHTIDASALRRIRADHGAGLRATENLAALRASGISDPELERALRALARRARLGHALDRIARAGRRR